MLGPKNTYLEDEGLGVILTAVGIWAARTGGNAIWRLKFAFIAMMTNGVLISSSGFNLPTLEPLIAGSVSLQGLLVFFRNPFAVQFGYITGRPVRSITFLRKWPVYA
jgi:hydrogenase/urease accessory protein HupE